MAFEVLLCLVAVQGYYLPMSDASSQHRLPPKLPPSGGRLAVVIASTRGKARCGAGATKWAHSPPARLTTRSTRRRAWRHVARTLPPVAADRSTLLGVHRLRGVNGRRRRCAMSRHGRPASHPLAQAPALLALLQPSRRSPRGRSGTMQTTYDDAVAHPASAREHPGMRNEAWPT